MDPKEEYYVIHSDNTRVASGKPQLIPHKTAKYVDVGRGISDYLPFIGDALLLGDAYENYSKGNYGSALANIALLAVPNIIEKPAKALIKTVKPLERKLLSVSKYGNKPYYTKADIDNRLDLTLKVDPKTHIGESFNNNTGKLDITGGNMNINGEMFNTDEVNAFLRKTFEEAPHGLIISFNHLTPDDPLSTDSYLNAFAMFDRWAKLGKGLYIVSTPGKFRLNSAGKRTVEESNKRLQRYNKVANTDHPLITLLELLPELPTWVKDPKLREFLAKKQHKVKVPYASNIEFIKYKKGGSL